MNYLEWGSFCLGLAMVCVCVCCGERGEGRRGKCFLRFEI